MDVVKGVGHGPVSGRGTKGFLGSTMERYFGKELDSDQRPDFPEAGVELKVVPLRFSSGRRRSKERTVITAIDFENVWETPFSHSHLSEKTRRILFVYFDHVAGAPMGTFTVRRVLLWRPDRMAELMLTGCYDYVRLMVGRGEAHRITEAATPGVGACTKGATGQDKVVQPVGTELAMRRAFAFKASFTTDIFRQEPQIDAPFGAEDLESVSGISELFAARLAPFVGRTVGSLAREIDFPLDTIAKNRTALLSRRLLDLPTSGPVREFSRLGATMRVVRLSPSGTPYESVSFPAFAPLELAGQSFEESELLEQVSMLIFVAFGASERSSWSSLKVLGSKVWRPAGAELETMRAEWEVFRSAFARSQPESAPKESETRILHVRPHGRDGRDLVPLPSGRPYRRSSFWLNKRFVAEILSVLDHA